MGSDFTPRQLDYTCFLPSFRISTYSELEGALGDTSTQIMETLKNNICKDVSKPPELAMYTIGMFDDYDMEPLSTILLLINALAMRCLGLTATHAPHMMYVLSYIAHIFPLIQERLDKERWYAHFHFVIHELQPHGAHFAVEEMVEITIESSASPERVLSPLTTSVPSIQTKSRVQGYSANQPLRSSGKPKVKKRTKPTTLLACYYCRRHKIRCGGRDEHDETRRQCQHRKQECQFPPRSNRGRRSNPETKSTLKKARKAASTKPTAGVTLAGIAEVV
ncbi:hypothetical protein NM688_g5912 [Phlebia brevispora]|uniref:Uncharacterized protein n=1 Tax=Phlebia brevispora TaxID=194682 RepID=A0ACC1SNA1_9APHY|nr:hypothetical protein NM688_g5912 [Phlebia brevispora]